MAKSVIEGIVIVCGILLSFFIGELNTNNKNIEIKKESLELYDFNSGAIWKNRKPSK